MTVAQADGPLVLTTELTVWPTGTTPTAENWAELCDYGVTVAWRGPRTENGYGGYAVTTRHGACQLSRAGKWAWSPERFRLWQYRWATLEEALAMAKAVVNDVQVAGRTWRQWCVYREGLQAIAAAAAQES